MENTAATLGLPQWVLIAFFFIGGISTIFQIVKTVTEWIKAPSLEVRLTKELFFRFLDLGECAFLNTVYLVRNGTIEINDVSVTLTRLGDPSRSYKLVLERIGEKHPGPGAYAETKFFTNSARLFLAPGMTSRPVFLCSFSQHRNSIQRALHEFTNQLYELRDAFKEKAQQPGEAGEGIQEYAQVLRSKSDEYAQTIFDFMQLEPGKFEMSLIITYSFSFMLRNRTKKSSSSLRFSVDEDYRTVLRRQLGDLLFTRGRNILLDEQRDLQLPEYSPVSIAEI